MDCHHSFTVTHIDSYSRHVCDHCGYIARYANKAEANDAYENNRFDPVSGPWMPAGTTTVIVPLDYEVGGSASTE